MHKKENSPFIGKRSDGTSIERPLSPHLQIYKLPLSGRLSALTRITALLATGGLSINIAKLFAATHSEKSFKTVQKFSQSSLGRLFLIGWFASLIMHGAGGVRHLLWDQGKRFSREDINKDSLTTVKIVLSLIAGTCLFVLFRKKK